MADIVIEIRIPRNRGCSQDLVLGLVAETLEDKFTEVEDAYNDEPETVADVYGFGGNTIMLTCGKLVREICL